MNTQLITSKGDNCYKIRKAARHTLSTTTKGLMTDQSITWGFTEASQNTINENINVLVC